MRRAIGRNTEDPIGLPHFPAGPGRGREVGGCLFTRP